MPVSDPTYIGRVASVTGAVVRIQLRHDMPSTLVMIEGESYRVGQIGEFLRIPLGYVNLYGVCTQVGADAAPPGALEPHAESPLEKDDGTHLSAYRWITVALFGEGFAGEFERGVGHYPTAGDEVHVVTNDDLQTIYGSAKQDAGSISVGSIAAASGISADINIGGLVSRHSAIVGSTGAGKSNLATVLLEALSDSSLPSARTLVIDPHGEYASALGDRARVFRIRPDLAAGERNLWVPFWALPFAELQSLTLGALQPNHEATIRDVVLDLKTAAAALLTFPPPPGTLTADAPVPFSIRRLWYDLDRFERITFTKASGQTEGDANDATAEGDAETLQSAQFPPADPYNKDPYKNQKKRNIERQLDLEFGHFQGRFFCDRPLHSPSVIVFRQFPETAGLMNHDLLQSRHERINPSSRSRTVP